jgi:hypothetical protein
MGIFTVEEIRAYNAVNNAIPDIKNRLRILADTEADEEIITMGEAIHKKQTNILELQSEEKFIDSTKWTRAATALGVGVVVLALWQLFNGVRGAMGWMRRKMAEDENYFEEEPHGRRIHARDWKISDI